MPKPPSPYGWGGREEGSKKRRRPQTAVAASPEPLPARVSPHTRAVVGLGDSPWGDEGVGPRVIELLRPCADTFRLTASRDMLALLDLGKSCQEVNLVDGARTGGAPGTILTWSMVRPLRVAFRGGNPLSKMCAHGLELTQVLMMAEDLGQLPEVLTLYVVVGESFAKGAPLSPRVEEVALELARQLS